MKKKFKEPEIEIAVTTSDVVEKCFSKPIVDMVNQPPHYTNGSIECIDALTAMIENWSDGNDAALSWQIVKYVWRHPYKGKSIEDLKKAQYYLNRLINYLENKK